MKIMNAIYSLLILVLSVHLILAQSSPTPSPTSTPKSEDIVGEVELAGIVCNPFIRGDANNDGKIDISDSIFISEAIRGKNTPECWDAADVNDDGDVNRIDYEYLVDYLFEGGSAPASTYGVTAGILSSPGYDESCDSINNDGDKFVDEGCPKIVVAQPTPTPSPSSTQSPGITPTPAESPAIIPPGQIPEEVIDQESCLDILDNYYDQETEKCIKGYDPSIIKNSCSDPDGGINIYERAHTFGFKSYSSADDPSRDLRIRSGGKDWCVPGENTLVEHFCTEEGYISHVYKKCLESCKEGVCIVELEKIDCVDSDDGINLYKKGYVEMPHDKNFGDYGKKYDDCYNNGKNILEYYCQSSDDPGSYSYECPDGCKDGACIGEPSSISIHIPGIIPKPEVVVYETKCFVGDINEKITSGCLLEDSCVPIGYRTGEVYCRLDGMFEEQRLEDRVCENNFECLSNVCVNDQCVSSGLLKKILDFFKRLFGG